MANYQNNTPVINLDNNVTTRGVMVEGLSGSVTSVSITLNGLSTNFPDDADFLLVGPDGSRNLLFWSDAGGTGDTLISGVTVTVSDTGPTALPNEGQIVSGETYRPANYVGLDAAEPEEPSDFGISTTFTINSGSEKTFANAFNGSNPNGMWTLYIRDDDANDPLSFDSWTLSITSANTAPVIGSDGGGDTAALSVAENTTFVTTVAATDIDAGDTLAYSVTGDDAALFSIDSLTGALTFNAAPNFESPADDGGDNIYDVVVTATDGDSLSDSQTLAIAVTDVAEQGPPPVSTVPSAGPDRLAGSDTPDQIFAGAGNDTVSGGGGDDTVFGGDGNDQVFGGDGNDQAFGGAGMDSVFGGAGDDQVYGGLNDDMVGGGIGNDTVGGGDGNDSIYGADGDDQLYGAAGDDQIQGGNGADTMAAGIGNDTVYAGDGDDVVYASDGNDLAFGGGGNDTLFGGAGSDTIWGGAGDDMIYGGAGADQFTFATGSGNDMIEGFNSAEGDIIDLQGQSYTIGEGADGDVLIFITGGATIELDGITQFETAFVA